MSGSSTVAGQADARRRLRDELRELGSDPYAAAPPCDDSDFFVTTLRALDLPLIGDASTASRLTICGRLSPLRKSSKVTFATLSTVAGPVQVALQNADPAILTRCSPGDIVSCSGHPFVTQVGVKTLLVTELSVLTKALRVSQREVTSDEWRARNRVATMMLGDELLRSVMNRSAIIAALRSRLAQLGFTEVETRTLVPNACGATARPFVTHHEALDMDLTLRVATEIDLKRLVIAGMCKVFEIGKVFRNEGVDPTHSPEFTSLEMYAAYAGTEWGMRTCEELVRLAVSAVNPRGLVHRDGVSASLTGAYRRVTMRELVREAYPEAPVSDLPMPTRHEIDDLPEFARRFAKSEIESYGEALQLLFDLMPAIHIWEPTFVTQHPAETSPLARCRGLFADRFELYACGMELANGYAEQTDPDEQRRVMRQQSVTGVESPSDEEFCDDLELGLPPTCGIGVGVDRLAMLATSSSNIRDVIAFPLVRSR